MPVEGPGLLSEQTEASLILGDPAERRSLARVGPPVKVGLALIGDLDGFPGNLRNKLVVEELRE
jgi:hypothetical protein